MTKVKSFKTFLEKGKTFRKVGEVPIDEEFTLPLKSLSAYEKAKRFDLDIAKAPTKTRKMTKEEKAEFAKENPNVSDTLISEYVVAYKDETDAEYLEKKKETDIISTLVEYCKFVDLYYPINKDTQLWQDLGLKSGNDLTGLVDLLFVKLELGEDFLKKMAIAINALENDPLFVKLAKLETLYKDKSMFEIMEMLNELSEKS